MLLAIPRHLAIAATVAGCCAHRFERPATLLTDADDVAARARRSGEAVQAFEYRTRVSYYGEGGARKGDVDVVGARPAKLRFEALTPTDDTVAVLATDGERFMSHERGQDVCYTGEACARNIARLLPLAFEGKDLFEVLVGGAALIAHESATVSWDDCEGVYILELVHGDVREVLWLRPDTFGPLRVRLLRGGDELWRLEHDDFETVDGHLLPRTLRFKADAKDVDLELKVREVWLNGTPGDAPFAPQCPEGTRQEELPCR